MLLCVGGWHWLLVEFFLRPSADNDLAEQDLALPLSWCFCLGCPTLRKELDRAIECGDRALSLAPNLESAQKLIVSRHPSFQGALDLVRHTQEAKSNRAGRGRKRLSHTFFGAAMNHSWVKSSNVCSRESTTDSGC